MKQIEYAKIMSNEEKEEIYTFFKDKNDLQLSISNNIIETNEDLLIDAYHEYERKILEEYENALNALINKIKLWENKTCECGTKMKFINHSFWGCPNYKDDSKNHFTFSLSQKEIFYKQRDNTKVRVNKDWATEIIRENNFRGKIKAKQLILFYLSIGLDDLRVKYGYKSTIESISSYVDANEESKKEEAKVANFMNNIFETLNSQLALKYKMQGEEEKICIIDLITSDDEDVFLIEIKRNTVSVDDNQLSLYYKLIRKIMHGSNDKRELIPLFIISNLDGYDDPNEYFFFENFDDITDKSELKRIMKMFKHN